MTVIETERLILRRPQGSDLSGWEPFVLSDRSRFVRSDPTPAIAFRSWGTIIGHWEIRGWGTFVFADKATGAPMGLAGPWFSSGWPEREIGWSVWDPAHEGKGLVAEAAAAARAHAFDALGWETAVSYIHRDNARSIALAERLGASLDATAVGPSDTDLVYRHPAP